MRQNFRSLILGSASISALVSTRCYPLSLPQQPTYPSITYQVISDTSEKQIGGADRIRRARIQIDIWAETILGCETLANLIRALLDGKDNTQSTTRFRAAWLSNEQDLYEESIEKYRISSDYEITYWSTT